jgi:UDP-glucose:glycoprotein glucosyltransferase
MILIADVESLQGKQLLKAAAEFSKKNPSVEIVIVPSSKSPEGISRTFEYMDKISFRPLKSDGDDLDSLAEAVFKPSGNEEREDQFLWDLAMSGKWTAIESLLGSLSLKPGQQGVLLNGRLVGPIPSDTELGANELEQLLRFERVKRIRPVLAAVKDLGFSKSISDPLASSKLTSLVALSFISNVPEGIFEQAPTLRINSFKAWKSEFTAIEIGDESTASIHIQVALDPASQDSQRLIPILKVLSELDGVYLKLFLNPKDMLKEIPIKRFYRYVLESKPLFNADGSLKDTKAQFASVPQEALLTVGMDVPAPWLVAPKQSVTDLDNIKLSSVNGDVNAVYELQHILIEGHSSEKETGQAPRGAQLLLGTAADAHFADTIIMANLGYFQFKANPGFYKINLQEGPSSKIFNIDTLGASGKDAAAQDETTEISLISFQGLTLFPQLSRNPGQETEDVLEPTTDLKDDLVSKGRKLAQNILNFGGGAKKSATAVESTQAEINIFSVASGHLYERMLNIMMVSVMKHTSHTVKFWFIEQFLSPSFKQSIPSLAAAYGFDYEMVTYKWPHWLRSQPEKQREIWGYKILFLDVLFPLSLDKVIFVDADQIVRTDMRELVDLDLQGAPYGFTPMCDSRTEMEGFRFWKQGYWKNYLRGLPYHISALYVVDLRRFREIAAGDRLRQQYHQLSADPNSLSNLDQDLPNHMQTLLPIFSLPQEWLWCETWCSDESLGTAKTIDLCNNPMTKEPKLDRARRQVPEWTVYDDEIAGVFRAAKEGKVVEKEEEEKNTKSRTMEAESTGKVKDEL